MESKGKGEGTWDEKRQVALLASWKPQITHRHTRLCNRSTLHRGRKPNCANPKGFCPEPVSLSPHRWVCMDPCMGSHVPPDNFSCAPFPPTLEFSGGKKKKAPLTYSGSHCKSQFVFFVLDKTQRKLLHLHLLSIFLLCSTGVCISLIRLSFILRTSLTTSGREVFQLPAMGIPASFNYSTPACNHAVTFGLTSALWSLPQSWDFSFQKLRGPSPHGEGRGAEGSQPPQGSCLSPSASKS